MEIEELVARCKDGDDAAIVTLYRLNIPRLKKIYRRIVRNEQAAEDIVHDAFIIIITSTRLTQRQQSHHSVDESHHDQSFLRIYEVAKQADFILE